MSYLVRDEWKCWNPAVINFYIWYEERVKNYISFVPCVVFLGNNFIFLIWGSIGKTILNERGKCCTHRRYWICWGREQQVWNILLSVLQYHPQIVMSQSLGHVCMTRYSHHLPEVKNKVIHSQDLLKRRLFCFGQVNIVLYLQTRGKCGFSVRFSTKATLSRSPTGVWHYWKIEIVCEYDVNMSTNKKFITKNETNTNC